MYPLIGVLQQLLQYLNDRLLTDLMTLDLPTCVTPVLSRMVERLVFREHISPAIPPVKLSDQYGFKYTGYHVRAN